VKRLTGPEAKEAKECEVRLWMVLEVERKVGRVGRYILAMLHGASRGR